MSPVNSDDSSGDALGGAGRPLTRKEIRAREKLLATQGHNVIPPQAFETGPDVHADAGTRHRHRTANCRGPHRNFPTRHRPCTKKPFVKSPCTKKPLVKSPCVKSPRATSRCMKKPCMKSPCAKTSGRA